MALIAFASAKGSPGVSVTVAGLARLWPRRALVADLDPAGGDTGLRYRRESGEPLDSSRGLLSLGAAVRAGQEADLDDHVQTTQGGTPVLVGITSPAQVLGLGAAWPHIALALHRARGYDVLADCGRLTPGSPAMAVVEKADAVVLLAGDELEDVAHLRERLRSLQPVLHLGSIDATPTGIALRAPADDVRAVADAEQLMASAGLPVRGLGLVAEDRKAAEALRTESGRNIRRSVLVRSLVDLTARVDEMTTLTGRIRQEV